MSGTRVAAALWVAGMATLACSGAPGTARAGHTLYVTTVASTLVRHRVVRDGLLVYTRDERRRVAFEARALTEYLDFQPVLARFDRILLSRAREGRLGT